MGFVVAGIARVDQPAALPARTAALERWLQAGYQASLGWMADPRPRRVDRSARYGWGRDYHRTIDRRLRAVGRWLSRHHPDCRWRVCVDSSPLMDKAWAEAAGIGWIGKHSNLIHPRHGSWLLLGHLLTTMELPADAPQAPLCGRCRRCLEVCPTGAIPEPFVVDSRACIAFHTIENRNPALPVHVAKGLQGWIAGCDLCQQVCPWNRTVTPTADPERQPADWMLTAKAEQLLGWDDGTWDEKLRGSALRRIKPWMWRRNIHTAVTGQP